MNAMPVPYVQPADVADAVLFLISDESRFVTGMQLRSARAAYVKTRLRAPF